METPLLKASIRETTGKCPARRLRVESLIPANLYGQGKAPVNLTVDVKELKTCMKTEWRMNTVLTLKTDKEETLVMVKEVQHHPVRHTPLHVDFLRVTPETPVSLNVPVRLDGNCIGVKRGGQVDLLRRVVRLEMPVEKIPAELVVDITKLDVNQQRRIKDLEIPEGCKPIHKDNYAVVQVIATREVGDEEGAEEAAPAAEA